MNIGLAINTSLLNGEDIRVLSDAGINAGWLNDTSKGSLSIFSGIDRQVFSYLLDYYKRHRKIPDLQVFRLSYPEDSYRLWEKVIPLPELIDATESKVNKFLLDQIMFKTAEFYTADKIDDAIDFLKSEVNILSNSVRLVQDPGYDITNPDYDIEGLLSRTEPVGSPFGIKQVDDACHGFLPGQLITLMGRSKAGKTWFTLNSALHAWKEGYSVLLFSVEMGNDLLQERILAMGAHVSPSRIQRGKLGHLEKDRVRQFHNELASPDSAGRFTVSKRRSLITMDDIRGEIKRYRPSVVYVDGFSFLLDTRTNRTTNDHEAHENIAAELKSLSAEEEIVAFVNTQVQEKQYSSKNGIEARTIAGGTGLLKASDVVIGLNREDNLRTLSSLLTRYEEFDPVKLEIDFNDMTFSVLEHSEEGKDKLRKMGV
jgi:archaellum biogenesis ATPase FlaH